MSLRKFLIIINIIITMNKNYLIVGGALLVLVAFIVISQSGSSQNMVVRPATQTATTSPDLTPFASNSTTVTTSASSSPEDIVPGLYPNPIVNTATTRGLKITSVMVENNVDTGGTPVSDHLQLTLQNLTRKTLSNLEAYYTVTDIANGKKEGYYKQLTGFTLLPNGSGTIHFDGQTEVGHYGVNMHGIYGTATDKLAFSVEVSAPGYAPVHTTAVKAPGGTEVVGQ